MAMRLAAILCRTLTGLLSFGISGYGCYIFAASGLHQDSIATLLFCALPMLSFPAFLLGFRERSAANLLHWALATCYLAVFSELNWRTCSELGYCGTVAATVLETLTAHPEEAMIGIAVLNSCAAALARKS
jgi:hypothetical protein